MNTVNQSGRPGKKDGTSDLDLPGEMDDRAWGCSMCDEYSREVAAAESRAEEAERLRALWFAENSGAQAMLGRVRELANEWERSGRPRIGASEAADELRAAIDGRRS